MSAFQQIQENILKGGFDTRRRSVSSSSLIEDKVNNIIDKKLNNLDLKPLNIFKAINKDKNAKNIIADYDISLKNETDWMKKWVRGAEKGYIKYPKNKNIEEINKIKDNILLLKDNLDNNTAIKTELQKIVGATLDCDNNYILNMMIGGGALAGIAFFLNGIGMFGNWNLGIEEDDDEEEQTRKNGARGQLASIAVSIMFGGVNYVCDNVGQVDGATSSALIGLLFGGTVGYIADNYFGTKVGQSLYALGKAPDNLIQQLADAEDKMANDETQKKLYNQLNNFRKYEKYGSTGKQIAFKYALGKLASTNYLRYIITVLMDTFISGILFYPTYNWMISGSKYFQCRTLSSVGDNIFEKFETTAWANAVISAVIAMTTFAAYANQTRFQWAYPDPGSESTIHPGSIFMACTAFGVLFLIGPTGNDGINDKKVKLILVIVTIGLLSFLNTMGWDKADISIEEDESIADPVKRRKEAIKKKEIDDIDNSLEMNEYGLGIFFVVAICSILATFTTSKNLKVMIGKVPGVALFLIVSVVLCTMYFYTNQDSTTNGTLFTLALTSVGSILNSGGKIPFASLFYKSKSNQNTNKVGIIEYVKKIYNLLDSDLEYKGLLHFGNAEAGKLAFKFLYTVIFGLGITFGISGDGTVKGILGGFVLITVLILFGKKAKIEHIYDAEFKGRDGKKVVKFKDIYERNYPNINVNGNIDKKLINFKDELVDKIKKIANVYRLELEIDLNDVNNSKKSKELRDILKKANKEKNKKLSSTWFSKLRNSFPRLSSPRSSSLSK